MSKAKTNTQKQPKNDRHKIQTIDSLWSSFSKPQYYKTTQHVQNLKMWTRQINYGTVSVNLVYGLC